MVDVAQLVRAPDCGSGGRGFKSHLPPKKNPITLWGFLFFLSYLISYPNPCFNLNILYLKL